jgi:hypothetical protein
MWAAAHAKSPQPPTGGAEREPVLRSIRSGLGFVARSQSLIGSFVIDLAAMGFGMRRALFPVLAVTVFHAGPEGAGLLLASVSAGATVAALTTPQVSAVSGGLACLGAVALVALLLPDLVRYDAAEMASLGRSRPSGAPCRAGGRPVDLRR